MSNGTVTPTVTPPEVEDEDRRGKTASLLATDPRDELAACIQGLRGRGVTTPDEFRALGAETIRDTIRWFDAQGERVTAGVLVMELRGGGRRGWRPAASRGQSSREYAAQIAAWLNEHFPDLQQASGNPHPAAVVEVIHLHHEFGKGRLLQREHAGRIRSAVRAFNKKWHYNPTEGSAQ